MLLDQLLEIIDREYHHRYKLHGYFPFTLVRDEQLRDPYDYPHCVCLFAPSEAPAIDKMEFDREKTPGVEPWNSFVGDEIENYEGAIANGCMLLTCDDPAKVLGYLRSRSLHR